MCRNNSLSNYYHKMSLLEVPNELLLLIAEVLDPKDLGAFLRVNRRFASLLTSPLYSLTLHDNYAVSAFKCAARNRCDHIIKFMISKGANLEARGLDGRTALTWATMIGNEAAAKILLENGASTRDALHSAARFGWAGMVRLLVDGGVDVDGRIANLATPLHMAAMYGWVDVIRALLDHGADILARKEMPDSTDQGTAAHLAAWYGHKDAVKVLLDAGSPDTSGVVGNRRPVV